MKNDKKSFKFYRSYYDVAKLLKPKHRLEFLMAILESHFDDHVMTTLSPTAHLAFIGQSHAIDKQLQGYKSMKIKELSHLPYQGPYEEIYKDNNNNNNNNKEKDNDKEKEHTLSRCMEVALRDSAWVRKSGASETELEIFNDHLILQGLNKKNFIDYKRHFVNWKKKNPATLIDLNKKNRDDSW